METPAIEFRGISKRFGGTSALRDVSFSLVSGECHAVTGENGAGKSTLGKILAGIHRPDAGTILMDGQPVEFRSPREARMAGIGMVHQELAFCPDLSVDENLALGRYPRHIGVFLDRRQMMTAARTQLKEIGPEIDPRTPMAELSIAHRQLVQVAAAVSSGAKVLIFDEPTSSLSETDAERLFGLMKQLRSRGVTLLYVSHRMAEIFRICDRISVLRDGGHVGTMPAAGATEERVVSLMIGRQVHEYFPHHLEKKPGEELLRLEDFSSAGKFSEISLAVRSGEILGFAGLVGSGRSEIAQAIFGLDPLANGRILLRGVDVSRFTLRQRIEAGIAMVPEDRKRQGLALTLSSRFNFSLTLLDRLGRALFLRRSLEQQMMESHFNRLGLKTASVEDAAETLSGGNQQKIVLAKWLARKAQVLILDEPTRGVDVGVKAAIYSLIDELARTGTGIILISSELSELLNLSTRILVMRQGRIAGELSRAEATQEGLLRLMSGLKRNIPPPTSSIRID
jgi:ABC-type sugar transport system ATPase subunit